VSPTEFLVTIASIVATVVLMRRRGESWGRSAIAGVIAWFGSAVLIVAAQILILFLVRGIFGGADASDVERWAPVLGAFAIAVWIGVAVLTVWLTLRFMRLRRGGDAP
jgi:formate-dependent nitrite reductase membrane component NrfD